MKRTKNWEEDGESKREIRKGGLYPIYIGPDDIWIFPHFLPGYMYKRFVLRIFLWFQVLFHACGPEWG